VDNCRNRTTGIHKTAHSRGQLPEPDSRHPQNSPLPWTIAGAGQQASTKQPTTVDNCRSRTAGIHKTAHSRGQLPGPNSRHPQNSPLPWTIAGAGLQASTKQPTPVDNCRSRTAGIHKTAHYRGQLPEPDGRHPQNSPLPWTIAGAGRQTSTKHPTTVDNCRSRTADIHKIAHSRGQLPEPNGRHPQNSPLPWTIAGAGRQASTKQPTTVDNCRSRTADIHKIAHYRGQLPEPDGRHPQNSPLPWTIAGAGRQASTKQPTPMDNCRSRTVGIHKTTHYRGQLPEPDGRHPQNSPLPWTIAGAGLQTSTKQPTPVDNCRSRTADIHKTSHYRGQLPEPDGRHPQNSPLPWTIAGAGLQTSLIIHRSLQQSNQMGYRLILTLNCSCLEPLQRYL